MLFFLLIFLSLSTFADQVALDDLANSKKWQKLLHYKPKLFGGWESQADGQGFFLHPNGKHDPLSELKESVRLFGKTSTPKDEDAACRFPARLKWLNQELGRPWKIDLSGCMKYVQFFSKVAAKRASIVFSSYYLSNPNSAFGHTFLRFSRYEEEDETEMLDYGINYAADARAADPFTYALKGLFGGFSGKFSAVPYYYKVREYSDYEFRDLWSYELNLSFPQVLEMVDHVWELGHTEFDYFYFKENCSYHLLSLIEVVIPSKDLTDNYSLFAIPADTIRLLKQEGLIGEGRKRDSTYTRLLGRSKGLTPQQLKLAKDISIEPNTTSEKIKSIDEVVVAARVLDVAIEAFDYYNAEKILSDEPEVKALKHKILSVRAATPVISPDLSPEKFAGDSPDDSHAPTRWSLSHGYQNRDGQETRLELRPALHDLLDPPQGSLKEAELEMGKVSFNYKQKNHGKRKLLLQELKLMNLKNYPGQNFWTSPLSWEIELGLDQLERKSCFDCPAPTILTSVGNSIHLFDGQILMAFLLNMNLELHNFYKENYRMGLGPKLITRFALSEQWMAGASAFHHTNIYSVRDVGTDYDLSFEVELRHHMHKKLSIFIKARNSEMQDRVVSGGEVGLQYFL